MNRVRFVLTAALLCFTGFILFAATVIAVMPDQFMYDLLRLWLRQRTTLSLSGDDFHKIFPLGFTIKRVSLKNSSGTLVYLDAMQASISPFFFFTGGVKINMHGAVRQGRVESTANMTRKKTSVKIQVKDIDAAAIPALRGIGFTGSGIVSGEANVSMLDKSCADGSIRMEGSDFDLNGLKVIGFLLLQDKARLSLQADTKDCRVKLKGLWIDWQDISSKLSGDIVPARMLMESKIDLTMEITPRKEAMEHIKIMELLSTYRRSSNYYLLHIKGSLGKPQLMQ